VHPAEIMLPPGATAQQIMTFRAEWGFDDPYWRFLRRAVHGDFGVSLRHVPWPNEPRPSVNQLWAP